MIEIADIPKLYTALAEWLSCMVYIMILKKRDNRIVIGIISVISLIALCVVQYFIGVLSIKWWLPGMIIAFAIMYLMIYCCCDLSLSDVGFCWAMAFVAAEFAASLEWQMYTFFYEKGLELLWMRIIFLILFFCVLYIGFYYLEKRYIPHNRRLGITGKEAIGVIILAIAVFLISNISYVYTDTPFSSKLPSSIFYIRTLVDFAGLVIMVTQQDRWREMRLKSIPAV